MSSRPVIRSGAARYKPISPDGFDPAAEAPTRAGEAGSPRPGKLHAPTLRSSVIMTLFVQIAVVISTFVQFGLISRWYGIEALGDFSLLMRVRGVLEFAVLLILPMALVRELAMRPNVADEQDRRILVQSGLALGGLCLALCVGALLAFPNLAAVVLFGRASFSAWIPPFSVLLAGYACCLMVSAIARGQLNFANVNILQFLYVAAVPIGLIVVGRMMSLRQVVACMGVGATLLAFAFYWRVRPRVWHPGLGGSGLTRRQAALSLLRYGVPRLSVITGMGLQSLTLPWLVNRSDDSTTLAALNSLLGVVSASSLLVAPLSMVMLPHLSRLIALGKKGDAGQQTSRMLVFALLAGGLGSLVVLAVIRPVLDVWLGPAIGRHTALLVASASVVPAILILEVMRTPVDSASTVPWNALTYTGGAVVTVATFAIMRHVVAGSIELAAATSLCLGMLTASLISIGIGVRLYGLRFWDDCLQKCAGAWVIGFLLLATGYLWATPWQQALLGLVCAAIYLAVLVCYTPSWLVELAPAWLRAKIWPTRL